MSKPGDRTAGDGWTNLLNGIAVAGLGLFGATTLLFTLAGVAAIGDGAPAGEIVRVGARWLGGAGAFALSLLLHRTVRQLRAREDEARVEQALQAGRLKAEAHPIRTPLGVVLLLGVVALVVAGNPPIHTLLLFLIIGVFTVYCGFVWLRQVLRPGPLLVLDEHGIHHAAYGYIPWQDINALHLEAHPVRYRSITTSTIYNMLLRVRQPARYLDRAPLTERIARWRWRRNPPASGVIRIPLNALRANPQVVFDVALGLRSRIEPPPVTFSPDLPRLPFRRQRGQ